MRIWSALLGLLAPEKYLHNQSLRDGEAHERQRHGRNAELAAKALEIARTTGMAVELKCTNSGWVELRTVPTSGKGSLTLNGEVVHG